MRRSRQPRGLGSYAWRNLYAGTGDLGLGSYAWRNLYARTGDLRLGICCDGVKHESCFGITFDGPHVSMFN